MGIGNAFQTDIFGEMVTLLQRLVYLLLAYRVLGQLVTAAQQTADNQRRGDQYFFHGVPQARTIIHPDTKHHDLSAFFMPAE